MDGGKTAVLADVSGEGAIKHFWITDSANYGRQLILRIYFDGQQNPSVLSPLSDFFANADYNEYRQINSLAVCYNPRKGMNLYFEMPYFRNFRVEIEIDLKEVIQYFLFLYSARRMNDILPHRNRWGSSEIMLRVIG